MNYYSVMEVSRHQNVLDIRRSYKTLSRRYHPDKNAGPDAEIAFNNVKLAYDVRKYAIFYILIVPYHTLCNA